MVRKVVQTFDLCPADCITQPSPTATGGWKTGRQRITPRPREYL